MQNPGGGRILFNTICLFYADFLLIVMFQFRWYVFKCQVCLNYEVHRSVFIKSDKTFSSRDGALEDYAKFLEEKGDMVADRCHELRVICEEGEVAAHSGQSSDPGHQVFAIDEVEMCTRFSNTHAWEVDDTIAFSGFLMERVGCPGDDHHMLVNTSLKTFQNPEDCIREFRLNSNFDKFNISNDWWFFVEAIDVKKDFVKIRDWRCLL